MTPRGPFINLYGNKNSDICASTNVHFLFFLSKCFVKIAYARNPLNIGGPTEPNTSV